MQIKHNRCLKIDNHPLVLGTIMPEVPVESVLNGIKKSDLGRSLLVAYMSLHRQNNSTRPSSRSIRLQWKMPLSS